MSSHSRLISIVVCLSAFASPAPRAHAHSVTVDGDPADWFQRNDLSFVNQGILAAGAQIDGEYVWLDAPGDERTDFSSPDSEIDLLEFRVTADALNIYFLARFANLTLASGNGAVQIQIAVDLDGVPGSGETFLGSFSDTSISPNAAWEQLIVTGFGSGRDAPYVYEAGFNLLNPVGMTSSAISLAHNCVELAVPWNLVGGLPDAPVHFTVSVLRSDATDIAWDVAGSSDILDALTNYEAPGTTPSTWAEVSDGVVDYHFELWLHLILRRAPVAPFVFREVLYDPSATQLGQEWISISNWTGGRRSLAGYRIGNAQDPGSAEGMRVFPPDAEIIGRAVIAQDAAGIEAVWAYTPQFELGGSDPLVPDLLAPDGWGGSTIQLGNDGDELLLIDPHWTIIDVVTWEDGSFPNIIPSGGAQVGQSIERGLWDTDDCSMDFQVNNFPVPFYPPTDAPGASRSRLVLEQNVPNPFNPATMISFELPVDGFVRLSIHDARGRLVKTLISDARSAGLHEVRWSGEDNAGRRVASGVYRYRIVSGGQQVERTMVLVK